MSDSKRPWNAGQLLLLFMIFAFFLFSLVIPLLLTLSSAFQRIDPQTFQVVDHFTLFQFQKFFGDVYYLKVLLKTVLITTYSTLFCLLLGYPFAVHMWKTSARERQVLRLILIAPLLLSFVILNFGWLIILAPHGVINELLLFTGIIRKPIPLLFTQGAVIVGLVQVHLPFMVLAIVNNLDAVRPEVVRAAASLGANKRQQFTSVIFPLSIGGAVSGCLICFATIASTFVTPALLGGPWVKTLASVIYSELVTNLDFAFGSAIAVVLLALTAFVTFALGNLAARLNPRPEAKSARRSPVSI